MTDQKGAFRLGQVVEVVSISYPSARAYFAQLYAPEGKDVIAEVLRATGRLETNDLVIETIAVPEERAGETVQRAIAVELRQDVEIGKGPLVAVINGMSARRIRDAMRAWQ